jgi:hypothetical protein
MRMLTIPFCATLLLSPYTMCAADPTPRPNILLVSQSCNG